MSSRRHLRSVGSGTVLTLSVLGAAVALLLFARDVGWSPMWRALGVTPLQPPFFDMHVINDYAACSSRGIDAYAAHACNVDNFNIPPTWLWLGFLGVDGSDSSWLSTTLITTAATVLILLFRGRRWYHGVMALGAILSPSVMMGVERGNLDLLILALVGAAALIYEEKKFGRTCVAIGLLVLGVTLKLVPIFCVSLVARFNRRTLLFASAAAALSLIYLGLIIKFVFLIRQNVPTTFILSYGYKAIFLGLDFIRSEAGLSPLGLADTWWPAVTVATVLIGSAIFAVIVLLGGREFCLVDPSAAGTAFFFGAGIYCGTYMLGTNFVYRLMFLLLCIPQLQDWQIHKRDDSEVSGISKLGLFGIILGVLWLNGSANGHSTFFLLPQVLNWLLFFCLSAVMMSNILQTVVLRTDPRHV